MSLMWLSEGVRIHAYFKEGCTVKIERLITYLHCEKGKLHDVHAPWAIHGLRPQGNTPMFAYWNAQHYLQGYFLNVHRLKICQCRGTHDQPALLSFWNIEQLSSSKATWPVLSERSWRNGVTCLNIGVHTLQFNSFGSYSTTPKDAYVLQWSFSKARKGGVQRPEGRFFQLWRWKQHFSINCIL